MKKLIALALLALTVGVYAGIPSNVRISAVLTPSGKVDTRYRDGDDGTAAIPIKWATIPAQTGVQGTPQSVNLRSGYLTEPGSPNATLSVSCTPTLGGGWSTTTDGLDYTYSGAYSGTCRVTATRNSAAVVSAPFSVTSAATSSADATAPAQVLGLTVTATATGIRLSWRPSSDPKVASEMWSGMGSYRLYRDGSGTAFATVSAPDTGLQVQLTGTEQGGSTGGSLSQSGTDYTIVSAGAGIGGTGEEGYFGYQQVSGDFRLCAEIHSLSGGDATNGHMALVARQSLTATDLAVMHRQNYTGIRTRYRGTTSGSTVAAGSQISLTGASWECLSRTGTTWLSEYSTTGATFTAANTSNPTALGSALYVGILGGDGGGSAITGDVRSVTLTSGANLTYDDAITDGASHSYVVKARDVAGNLATASLSASATAPSVADSTAPSAPTNITGSTVSTSAVAWTWTICTDASGIANYTPAVSTTLGGTYTDQTPVTGNTFQLTGLSPSTTRYLKVKCTDGAGNASSQSTPGVSATSAASGGGDTTKPTVPSGNCYVSNWIRGQTEPAHTPCATGLSTSTFRIKTTGSTDAGSGVAGYRLYMASSAAGPFTLATSFTGLQFDYNLGSAQPRVTKYFKLTAVDVAGNESAQSATFSDWTALASGGTPAASELFSSVCPTCGTMYLTTNNPPGYPYDDTSIYNSTWSSSSDPSRTAGWNGCSRALDSSQSLSGTAFHYRQNNQIQGAHCMIVWHGPVGGGKRANFVPGFEYNIAVNLYLKGNTWSTDSGGFKILFQLHGNNTGTANNPHFKIDAADTTGHPFHLHVLGDTTNQKPYERSIHYSCSLITEDTWHRFVVQVKFGDATTGYIKVYHNDELCLYDQGLNYFQGDIPAGGAGPFTSIGIYNGWDDRKPGAPSSPTDAQCRADPTISSWCTPPDGNREGYFDNWILGRGDLGVGYQEVAQ